MPRKHELGGTGTRQDAALEALEVLRGDAEVLHRLGHLAYGFSLERLALVERQESR